MTDPQTNRGAFHHIDLSVSDVAAARRVYAPVLDFLGYTMVKDRPDGCEWDVKGREPFGASLGIRTLVTASKTLRSKNGNLVLFAPQPNIEQVLHSSGIDTIIPVVKDLEAAQAEVLT